MLSHHHIKLDREFKDDCEMWRWFLLSEEKQGICRPFLDLHETLEATVLDLYTDAAKGRKLGMGGVFQQDWFFAKWETNYIEVFDPSIEYLELLGVCTAAFIWTNRIKNKRVVLFCDNQSVVSMVNSSSFSCKNCMKLLRLLTLRCMQFNTRVFARWVRGSSNLRADMLSRQKILPFLKLKTQDGLFHNELPEKLPEELWPASKLWIK